MEADATTGAAIREYIWLDDIPVGLVDHSGATPALYSIHTDHLGRPQKLTDGSGAIVWDAAFDPFGNIASLTGSVTNPLRFPGQYADSETALAQNGFRDYDSVIGRYAESDPVGLEGRVDTYSYANSNPLLLIDPLGLAASKNAVDVILGVMSSIVPARVPKRFACYAFCPTVAIGCPPPECPQIITGRGVGGSPGEAVRAARANANSQSPRGCQLKHCRYACVDPKGNRFYPKQ